MKKLFFILLIAFSVPALYAQKEKDTTFYRHEVKISVSDALLTNLVWISSLNEHRKTVNLYVNVAFSYLYRPVKWFWIGGNFINYFGNKTEYKWKEYNLDGSVGDFSKSKPKYCAVLAPEIRFSYLNKSHTLLYSALSAGICIENGYDNKHDNYPELHTFFQITLFGVSGSFGKNENFFLDAEFGVGMKGFIVIQGGYRF
jgi:hypothetical protein